eukprot:52835-Amphidinium_carterae.1
MSMIQSRYLSRIIVGRIGLFKEPLGWGGAASILVRKKSQAAAVPIRMHEHSRNCNSNKNKLPTGQLRHPAFLAEGDMATAAPLSEYEE